MTFRSKIRTWKTLKVEHEGRILLGSYACRDELVEVRSMKGARKATLLDGSTPECLAKLMLLELAAEGKA